MKDRASLDAACRGTAAVITTASTTFSRQAGDSIRTVDREGQQQLVDAAKAARVSRFVYVSYSHNIDVDCPLTTAKRTVEAHLQRTGMTYTILAPSVFMEVWLSAALGFDAANAPGRRQFGRPDAPSLRLQGGQPLAQAGLQSGIRAVQYYPEIRAFFKAKARRKPIRIARTLVALELARMVYQVLAKQEAFNWQFKNRPLSRGKHAQWPRRASPPA